MSRCCRGLLLVAVICAVAGAVLTGLVWFGREEIRVVKKRHDNGRAKEEWVYKRDILGRQEKVKEYVYFESGCKECEVDYRRGRVNGWARMWYESGQLYVEATYKNDRPHGTRLAYHENGQLFCRACYDNGKLLKRENWDEEGNEIYLDMERPDPF